MANRRKSTSKHRYHSWHLLILSLGLTASPSAVQPCTPDIYLLFRGEARTALDTLSDTTSVKGAFMQFVLMHNLAFEKDRTMRERAESLLKTRLSRAPQTSRLKAYTGSLRMIKVSQRSTGSNIFRKLNLFAKSPQSEARDAFRLISDAVTSDSTDRIIRMLRATAAVESAEHLSELFPVARQELTWLDTHIPEDDSVMQFFTHLNWAKYYFKLAQFRDTPAARASALARIERAQAYACTPVFAGWAAEWKKRIEDLPDN
jgi:hypothetical protein